MESMHAKQQVKETIHKSRPAQAVFRLGSHSCTSVTEEVRCFLGLRVSRVLLLPLPWQRIRIRKRTRLALLQVEKCRGWSERSRFGRDQNGRLRGDREDGGQALRLGRERTARRLRAGTLGADLRSRFGRERPSCSCEQGQTGDHIQEIRIHQYS